MKNLFDHSFSIVYMIQSYDHISHKLFLNKDFTILMGCIRIFCPFIY